MLLKYSFKNFCSFKDDVEFSMLANEDAKLDFPLNYVENEIDVLKTAVIVGENAGGKTNFVKSLSYLKKFFKENNSVRTDLKYINDNYKKGAETKIEDTTQAFSISALIDDTIYNYSLELDYLGIKSENFSTKRLEEISVTKIFELHRQEKNISLIEPVKMTKLVNRENLPIIALHYDLIKDDKKTREFTDAVLEQSANEEHSGLNLTKLAILGVKSAVTFTKWLNETLFVNVSCDGENFFQSKKLNYEDSTVLEDKENFLPILQMADPSIKDFSLDKKSPFSDTVIIRETENGLTSKHELTDDSTGIRYFFPLAIQIYKVVYQNKIVFVDEMDRSLNPVLSDKIVAFINGSDHFGQFIFTTHNAFHLDLNIYMKEQIYFVTKNLSDLTSEMYSLADFPDVTYEESEPVYNFYLRGVLGGTTLG